MRPPEYSLNREKLRAKLESELGPDYVEVVRYIAGRREAAKEARGQLREEITEIADKLSRGLVVDAVIGYRISAEEARTRIPRDVESWRKALRQDERESRR